MSDIPTYNTTGRIANYQDRVFNATSLANAGNTDSAVFRFAEVGARVELEVVANTEITIADTKSLTVSLFYDEVSTGSFASSRVIKAIAASGSAVVIPAGSVICKYTPDSDVDHFGKVRVATTGDQSTDKVDANLYYNYN